MNGAGTMSWPFTDATACRVAVSQEERAKSEASRQRPASNRPAADATDPHGQLLTTQSVRFHGLSGQYR